MAPKAKKGKQQDDWDEGLGEVADPIAQAEAEAKVEEDEEPTGGLMAALRKNKEKRKKKGKAVDDWEEDAPPEIEAKAPVEASMDDEFAEPVKKKGAKATQEDEDTGGIKTKAQKEKEKKEREKQRKKEQAAAKKKSTPAPAPKVEVAPVEVAPVEPPKKKKLNPALAALQKQQEELRRRQEADLQARADEESRLLQEQKLAEEEEKRRAEQKAAKKEREKKKIEEMKKAGTYKTEKQKAAEAQAKLRAQQMLESGIVKVAALEGEPVRKEDRRKKNPRKEAEERKAQQAREEEEQRLALRLKEEAKKVEEEAAKAKANAEEKKAESSDEDWEALADKDLKESWDAESEEEDIAQTQQQGSKDQDSEEEEEDDSSDESESDEETVTQRQLRERKDAAREKRLAELAAAKAAANKDDLRSPIICVLGHVDTGKTSLLDHIRRTNVQSGEAGGITQQIGSTFIPREALETKTAIVNSAGSSFQIKVPGLLCLDTPGHASFSNLRSRGSSLCNIAVLVVDITHGLEPQTLESMKLLRNAKTPFIVALNKIDRLFSWQATPDNGFRASLNKQKPSVVQEFRDRLERVKLAFSEQSFNAELFDENKSMAKNVSLVPTSAHTGEGIPDLLKLLIVLTQERMTKQLMYTTAVEASVLEVKTVEGLGTTIDVILINGVLNVGDRIVLCGTEGPIVTDVRGLLTPQILRESRVKSSVVPNQSVKAAIGVRIAGDDLATAIAGSRVLVMKDKDDEDEQEELEEEVMSDLEQLMSKLSRTGKGVSVHASTLGALEALLAFLKESSIPVANIAIGDVARRDVVQVLAMKDRAPQYAIMLCFNVKIDKEAQLMADSNGIKVFSAEIIYHLFDAYNAHMKAVLDQKREDSKLLAVFPAVLRQVAVFNKREPIVVGVDVIDGELKLHTPLSIVRVSPATKQKEIIPLGRVTSIERDHKQLSSCKKGQPSVAIKIEGSNQPTYGRNIAESDTMYSAISRASIDTLKLYYREEVSKDDWQLIAKQLKPLFDIS